MSGTPNHPASDGIFLMYGGCPKTIFESQVLVHVRSMQQTGIHMEVWSFAGRRKEYYDALTSAAVLRRSFPEIRLRLFRAVRPALPGAEWLNAVLLLWWMWRLRVHPSFIHARTEYAAAVAAIAKHLGGYRLIWDARGATLNEFKEYSRRFASHWKWWVAFNTGAIARRLKMASSHCDGAIFVSDALRNLEATHLNPRRTLVVPCLADESLFFFDSQLRRQARMELGYTDSTVVLAYVGSTVSWQCIPETIQLMQRALRINNDVRILIITPERAIFEEAFSGELSDRVHITTGALREINRYLNAADFGVLLRKPNLINAVASPVKFAEYSLAGLTVITTSAVEQVKEFGGRLGNTVDPEQFLLQVERGIKSQPRSHIAAAARLCLGRHSHIEALAAFYRALRRSRS